MSDICRDFSIILSELIHSEIEQVSNLKDIRHPLIREAMKYLDMHVEIRMSYGEVDLPARSGLGTSSSFAIGFAECIPFDQKGSISVRKIWQRKRSIWNGICAVR